MSVALEIKTVCEGTIRETWRVRVTAEQAARIAADPGEALDVLDEEGCEVLGIDEECDDEHDREIVSVEAPD